MQTEELVCVKLQNEEVRSEVCETKKQYEILEQQHEEALIVKDQLQQMYESQVKQSDAQDQLLNALRAELDVTRRLKAVQSKEPIEEASVSESMLIDTSVVKEQSDLHEKMQILDAANEKLKLELDKLLSQTKSLTNRIKTVEFENRNLKHVIQKKD